MSQDEQKRPVFAHPAEEIFARILDFYGIRWEYEPHTFPLEWDENGNVTLAFSPDFYLPEQDLYIELTTLRPQLSTRKNKKIRLMNQLYPHIKIIYSFGGWTWSGGFGQAAANPAAFAETCYNLIHDPRWDGLFDGIDIDWEYPNACGLTCDNSGEQAFKNLMAALRARFGSELVTAAVPAGYANINAADYAGAAQYVDWYNVMTYDFFGAWDNITAPHSPLYSYAGIPIAQFYSDYAIQLYKSKGVPGYKLLLGVGFYGRGWTGVNQAAPGGTASGPAQGTYEPGIEDYKVLKNTCPATNTVGGTAYAYCSNNWWSYDTPSTLAVKMNYLKSQGLRGVFFWELSGDTSNGELINALYTNR